MPHGVKFFKKNTIIKFINLWLLLRDIFFFFGGIGLAYSLYVLWKLGSLAFHSKLEGFTSPQLQLWAS